MNWFLLILSVVMAVVAIVQIFSPNDVFMRLFFRGLEEDKYIYDRAKFRILYITMSLLGSILLLLFFFTRIYWVLILTALLIVAMAFYTHFVVRKRKDNLK